MYKERRKGNIDNAQIMTQSIMQATIEATKVVAQAMLEVKFPSKEIMQQPLKQP